MLPQHMFCAGCSQSCLTVPMLLFAAEIRDKKPTSFKISKIIFSPEGCLLFLNTDI
jgi:hypothetical protein